MAWLWLVPVYLVIGVGVVAWAYFGTPRDQRPDWREVADDLGLLMTAVVIWPLILFVIVIGKDVE